MTQQIESPRGAAEPLEPVRGGGKTPWWKRPWMIPLGVVVVAVMLFIWPHYIGLDRSKATVALPPEHPFKYPILLGHITFGTIAVLGVFFQVWSRFRKKFPKAHRIIGRVYLLGGVLPSAILATILISYLGGPGWIGRIVLNTLWVTATVLGFVYARKRRYEEHRRYMIYSFALTMDAFSTRFLQVVLVLTLPPDVDLVPVIEAIAWLGWLTNVLIAYWWIERGRRRPQRVRLATAKAAA